MAVGVTRGRTRPSKGSTAVETRPCESCQGLRAGVKPRFFVACPGGRGFAEPAFQSVDGNSKPAWEMAGGVTRGRTRPSKSSTAVETRPCERCQGPPGGAPLQTKCHTLATHPLILLMNPLTLRKCTHLVGTRPPAPLTKPNHLTPALHIPWFFRRHGPQGLKGCIRLRHHGH